MPAGMADEGVIITPYQDGPYLVRGPVVLRDQAGRSITINRRTVALCRCGKSRMRPFCDGTHHVIRFRAPSSAEPPAWLQGGPGGEDTGSARDPTGD
jgi:CDGSH-type Zn-finger protein